MKKIIMASLLFLAACGGGNQEIQPGQAFIGGNLGIDLTFEPISTLDGGVYSIFDDDLFSLSLIAKNSGEHTLNPGDLRVKLLGPSQASFNGIPNWELTNEVEIEKISEFNPTGGEDIIAFTPNGDGEYLPEVIGLTEINWNVEYEYDYQTKVVIDQVCFNEDFNDDRICQVREQKPTSVSGSPIQITKVEQDTAGRGIIVLKIDLENKDVGESTIIGQDFDDRFNQVTFFMEDQERWECKSGGRVNQARLVENKAQVICRLTSPLDEGNIFVEAQNFYVDFTYRKLIQEKLRIQESSSD